MIIGWLIFLGLVSFLVHKSIFATKAPDVNNAGDDTQITIYRDYDSHFRLEGSINGVAVTFLIDTGATSVAIPGDIADAAGLIRSVKVQNQTANGVAIGYLTKIKNLDVGPLNFSNVSATIIPTMDSDDVLLGMNILSKFEIKQTKSKLTITVPRAQN